MQEALGEVMVGKRAQGRREASLVMAVTQGRAGGGSRAGARARREPSGAASPLTCPHSQLCLQASSLAVPHPVKPGRGREPAKEIARPGKIRCEKERAPAHAHPRSPKQAEGAHGCFPSQQTPKNPLRDQPPAEATPTGKRRAASAFPTGTAEPGVKPLGNLPRKYRRLHPPPGRGIAGEAEGRRETGGTFERGALDTGQKKKPQHFWCGFPEVEAEAGGGFRQTCPCPARLAAAAPGRTEQAGAPLPGDALALSHSQSFTGSSPAPARSSVSDGSPCPPASAGDGGAGPWGPPSPLPSPAGQHPLLFAAPGRRGGGSAPPPMCAGEGRRGLGSVWHHPAQNTWLEGAAPPPLPGEKGTTQTLARPGEAAPSGDPSGSPAFCNRGAAALCLSVCLSRLLKKNRPDLTRGVSPRISSGVRSSPALQRRLSP